MVKFLEIVLLCIVACAVYGIVHDQITARICVEYFTIGHAPIFGTDDPTILGLGWGIVATWWVGLIMGVPLAVACRVGSWPQREPLQMLAPLGWLMLASFALATIAGCVGWVAASNGWVFLLPPMSDRVPEEKHVFFLVDLWAHTASYAGGFLGGCVVIVWVILKRRRQNHQAAGTIS